MDAEPADADRPSFTSFWKRNKQKDKDEGAAKKKGKKTTSPSSTGELPDEGYAEDQEANQDAGEC